MVSAHGLTAEKAVRNEWQAINVFRHRTHHNPRNATILLGSFVPVSGLFSGEQELKTLIKFMSSSGLAGEPVTEDISIFYPQNPPTVKCNITTYQNAGPASDIELHNVLTSTCGK